MRALIFGATGMIGQGLLRECLLDPSVSAVLTVGRSRTGQVHPKLKERLHPNLFDYGGMEAELRGWDACFFCLGVTAAGRSEAEYTRLTYDLTLAAARPLAEWNPGMTFLYVSGTGTDGSGKGRTMWARVKGRTENEILRLPFRASFAVRPAAILPSHGERSRTAVYRAFYTLARPLFPLLRRVAPNYVVTTEELGRAMIHVARHGAPKRVLESPDIRQCAVEALGERQRG